MIRKKLLRPIREFIQNEQASGILLIACTIIPLILANTFLQDAYHDFWHTKVGFENNVVALRKDLSHWVNDGLMAIFFLLVGLEIKREIFVGELSSVKKSMLPVIAALGGMVVPALIFVLFNAGTSTANGWAIPMATDIAFALGVLGMMRDRVPVSIKIFMTALAIIDDLGAIIVIALFYTEQLLFNYLLYAGGVIILLIILNRMRVMSLIPYLLLGLLLWYFVLKSGIHATIAGVLLAFAFPLHTQEGVTSPLHRLEHALHKPVAFVIMPIFALANTGVTLAGDILGSFTTNLSLGILLGLVIGKPLGIFLFSYVGIKLKMADLPRYVLWKHIAGASFLGGIGFTMSFFISFLALQDPDDQTISKISILSASVLAGLLGFLFLRFFSPPEYKQI